MYKSNRISGVCNCPFRVGYGAAVCRLDNKPCRVLSMGVKFYCRGWQPNGKPSDLQNQGRLV